MDYIQNSARIRNLPRSASTTLPLPFSASQSKYHRPSPPTKPLLKPSMSPFHVHDHDHRHRRLLSPLPDPLSKPTCVHKTLIISFTAVLFATVVYLILNSLLKCIHCIRRRLRQEHPPARSTEQDPDSLAQLRAIPVQVYDGPASCSADVPEAEICLVCLAEYEAGEEVRVLPGCGHVFHRACIDRWLITRSSSSCCPICRVRVIRRSVEPTVAGCSRDGAAVRFVMAMETNILPTHPASVL